MEYFILYLLMYVYYFVKALIVGINPVVIKLHPITTNFTIALRMIMIFVFSLIISILLSWVGTAKLSFTMKQIVSKCLTLIQELILSNLLIIGVAFFASILTFLFYAFLLPESFSFIDEKDIDDDVKTKIHLVIITSIYAFACFYIYNMISKSEFYRVFQIILDGIKEVIELMNASLKNVLISQQDNASDIVSKSIDPTSLIVIVLDKLKKIVEISTTIKTLLQKKDWFKNLIKNDSVNNSGLEL